MGDKSLRLSILGNNLDAKAKLDEIDSKAAELAQENPTLSIGINKAAADEKLAYLRAKLKSMTADPPVIEPVVEDDPAKAEIADLQLKLARLRLEKQGIKVSVDAGAAEIKLAELKAQIDSLDKKPAGITAKSLGAGAFDFASGGLSGGWQDMNLFQKAIAGVGVATGIAEPAVAGLTVVTGALAAGTLSAGLGLGVFGLIAKGVYSQVSTAVTDWGTASNLSGTQATAAMKTYQSALNALPPAQQGVARSIIGAEGAWQSFVGKNTAGVATIMSQGIGLLPKVFQAMQPFLAPTEKALSGIIGSLSKGLDSKGFKSWIDAFAGASGSNLTNLGKSIGNIVGGLGGILKAFLPMSTTMTGGLESITKKFEKWGTTLSGHSGFKDLIAEATQEGPKLVSAFKNIGGAVKNLLGDMAGMTTMSNSTLLWDMLNPLTGIIKLLSGNPKLVDIALWGYAAYTSLKKVTDLKKGITGTWTELQKMSGPLTKVGSSLKILKTTTNEAGEAQVAFNMELLASPITWIVLGLVILVAGIYELSEHSEAFRAFWKAAWKDIKAACADAFDWVKHNWPLILAILLGPIAVAALEIYKHWHQIADGAEIMFHAIAGWFEKLPALLLGYVKDFGHLLMSAGSSLISGLMNGIDNEAGKLWSKITNIGGKISGVFKSALSIFSPSKVFADHGKNIVLGLVQGIDGSAHLAEQSVSNLAQKAINASAGHFPGNSTSSTAGAGVLQLEWTGSDQEIITLLKKWVRVRGGDPGVFGR